MTEHLDVVVIGAGLSGIDGAYRILEANPGVTYAVLEGRDSLGGTWDLFRYPGVRSDSDMFTLAYPFRPWTGEKSLSDGASIREYIRQTAEENGIADHIRYGHRVTGLSWSSADARWTVTATTADGPVTLTASMIFAGTGYYRYGEAFVPDFPGMQDYRGEVVVPQFWPEDLDYAGKKVLVIGSGATAVTLVPSMAGTAEHVTMLQRSPSYVMALPGRDKVADALRGRLPAGLAHRAARVYKAVTTLGFYLFCRAFPKASRRILQKLAARQLPEGYPVDVHFAPRYDPWDQRLCLVPDGDFFGALRRGEASIVTDQVERFTEKGVRLCSGDEIEADVVVSATGLQVAAFDGVEIDVDGEPVALGDKVLYRGAMLEGVPNLVYALGYSNASWTLRADLTAVFAGRFLRHLRERGYEYGTPRPSTDVGELRPPMELKSNYLARANDRLPKQGSRAPWLVRQNWVLDSRDAKRLSLDEEIEYSVRKPVGVA
ncbi:flavin-containing monooxygenase [Aeromicrobium massiliense]|uniref:flavin-containing monooxygenase n=1 Tax=Aeromicrobium massiliense TaxID=1464554 RepID=UPI0002E7E268|nr:NAD(P)/FAD-dependent oxidoreductase [Aeromicrobium massiliense]